MPKFNDRSLERLQGVHPDLISLFMEVVAHRDCSVTCGIRTTEEQQALYAKGRSEPGEIVTYVDGVQRRSKHQDAMAVDVVPYPEMWDDDALRDFGNFVKGIAVMMHQEGRIDHIPEWGGDWKWKDRPHWQI
jgi:peptidoglycan L-alanyl-D-glutamate endopeptidase CwlK